MPTQDSTIDAARVRPRAARFDLRAAWVQIHLWLGLTLGILGAVLAVTGSILGYDHAIDAWLSPDRWCWRSWRSSASSSRFRRAGTITP